MQVSKNRFIQKMSYGKNIPNLQGRKQTVAQPQNNQQDQPSFLELYFWAICVFC